MYRSCRIVAAKGAIRNQGGPGEEGSGSLRILDTLSADPSSVQIDEPPVSLGATTPSAAVAILVL